MRTWDTQILFSEQKSVKNQNKSKTKWKKGKNTSTFIGDVKKYIKFEAKLKLKKCSKTNYKNHVKNF